MGYNANEPRIDLCLNRKNDFFIFAGEEHDELITINSPGIQLGFTQFAYAYTGTRKTITENGNADSYDKDPLNPQRDSLLFD